MCDCTIGIGGTFANGAKTGAFSYLFGSFVRGAQAAAAKSRLSLTGHSVGGVGPTHTAIQYVDENGNIQTLSAAPRWGINGSDLGFLQSDLNRPEDLSNAFIVDITPPSGVSVNSYWQSLRAVDRAYLDNLDYDLFPELFSDRGFNSNSYTFGLIQGTGGTVGVNPSNYFGGATPIPLP